MSERVSIVIKALNEEAQVEAAIRSALAAVKPFGGEVILADSASTDRTVEIARRFPITIVQLADPTERRCGVGPQLGYQYATGDFIYILDGDMELDPEFIKAAMGVMRRDPRLGGVAGIVEQQQGEASYQFRGLKRRRNEARPGTVRWLDMGGLYRRSALQEVGYFSDRNLHAFEELELGLRLTSAGWTLQRLPIASVRHHGYDLGTLALLKRRWKTGYLLGAGEVLRASWRQPYFLRAVATQKHLLIALGLWVALVIAVLALPLTRWPLVAVALVLLTLICVRAARSGSVRDALLGQLVWQVHAVALVRGILAPREDPRTPIGARDLTGNEAARNSAAAPH